MVTRLVVRLERASLFLPVFSEYFVRDRLGNIEFLEAWVIYVRFLRAMGGLLEFIEPMIDLFNAREKGCKIGGLRPGFQDPSYLLGEYFCVMCRH